MCHVGCGATSGLGRRCLNMIFVRSQETAPGRYAWFARTVCKTPPPPARARSTPRPRFCPWHQPGEPRHFRISAVIWWWCSSDNPEKKGKMWEPGKYVEKIVKRSFAPSWKHCSICFWGYCKKNTRFCFCITLRKDNTNHELKRKLTIQSISTP